MYDQPTTGRRTRQLNVFLALPTIEEARDPPSSDSHLAYESSSEGEDSESGLVLLTSPFQRSPAPASTARGSPASQVSRSASGSPTPSVPASLSTSFSNFNPRSSFQGTGRQPHRESVDSRGPHTWHPAPPPFLFFPTLSLSTHAQKRANIQQCWRSPQPSPHIIFSSAKPK